MGYLEWNKIIIENYKVKIMKVKKDELWMIMPFYEKFKYAKIYTMHMMYKMYNIFRIKKLHYNI